jgi:uncharacterized protein (TIRG00374 family)
VAADRKAEAAMRRWILSLLISALLLTWLFRRMEPGELGGVFSSLSWPHLILGVLAYLVGLLLRALRYRVLLNRPPGLWPLLQVTQVRNMLADLLPARIGTLSYVYLAVRRFGADFGDALSSFFSVFFLDMAALAPLFALAVLSLGKKTSPSSIAGFALLGGLLLAAAVGALALLPLGLRILERLTAGREGRWIQKARKALTEMASQYELLLRRRALWPAFGLSIGVRLAKYTGWYFLLLAVITNHPDAPASVPFPRALIGVLSAEFSSALPLGGLAGFGTYEAAWALGFGAIGFSASLAAASGFATHLISQLIDYGFGVIALLLIYRPSLPKITSRRTAAVLCLLAIPLAALAAPRFWNRWFPPDPGQSPSGEEEVRAFREAGKMIGRPAVLIWSSTRGGNHELYSLELPEGRLQALTKDPAVDFYGRFSPDGERILFLRSRETWVSFREYGKWDAWVMDSDGRRQELLVEGAYHPSWWPDGRSIVYHRKKRLLRYHLRKEREEVLADGRERPFKGRFTTPYVAPDGRSIALTLRGSWRGVGVWKPGRNDIWKLDRADGCQLSWSADGSTLIWVSGGGRKKNRILHVPAEGGEPAELLDLPGPYSHEYFPRVSNDNRFLVLAAAAKGHEHDRADYEIFLWEMGRPPETALRVTWHTGNDQWPDLWVEP